MTFSQFKLEAALTTALFVNLAYSCVHLAVRPTFSYKQTFFKLFIVGGAKSRRIISVLVVLCETVLISLDYNI